MTYLDVWRSGTFLLYSCKAAFWIQETSLRLSDVERSVVLRSVFAIGSAFAYLLFFRECATPPHILVRHTTWLSFTRPSPALVLQATNAGARRPGYEAIPHVHCEWYVPRMYECMYVCMYVQTYLCLQHYVLALQCRDKNPVGPIASIGIVRLSVSLCHIWQCRLR